MSYTADPKDPAESAIFSLDIVYGLAADSSETISSVTAEISVHEGSDPDVGQMLYGPAGVSGTEISQRVKGGRRRLVCREIHGHHDAADAGLYGAYSGGGGRVREGDLLPVQQRVSNIG